MAALRDSIKETYKNSITQFLQDYSVYDCLPKNSLVISLFFSFFLKTNKQKGFLRFVAASVLNNFIIILQIVVIDRNFSCYEAIDLIVSNDYEECTVWNSDFAKFDGLITHSDIIKMVLAFFENTV